MRGLVRVVAAGRVSAAGDGDVLTGSSGVAGEPEHGVAVGRRAFGGRAEDSTGEGCGAPVRRAPCLRP
ncbi:hypothetical protein [Streptomyces sp. PTD5-9]|uniref:hypothetical protein n=1 Tax=Streptomyces sp. PTD5-9 TaxID=3120150 RepID=UPI003FCC8323